MIPLLGYLLVGLSHWLWFLGLCAVPPPRRDVVTALAVALVAWPFVGLLVALTFLPLPELPRPAPSDGSEEVKP